MFVGRTQELKQLQSLYRRPKSAIAVIYGRRRIGKSSLIEHFLNNKSHLKFQGLEGLRTPQQITHFVKDLAQQINDPILAKAHLTEWREVFDYLTTYLKKKKSKQVLFIDELQWLAAGQSELISLMQKYWDTEWKNLNILLILCGSVSSYMVKRVIQSTAFYGRINWSSALDALSPNESLKLLKSKRNYLEIFKYLLVLGGIPKYLENVNTNKSFEQNVEDLFFKKDSILLNEYENIFYSQFKEHTNYEKIVKSLEARSLSLDDVSKLLKLKSSGGVKSYLDNLEKALFITPYTPFNKGLDSKLKLYKLTDEYLRFYFKYIRSNQKLIQTYKGSNLFKHISQKNFDIWMGLAFENFCLKNAHVIAEKLGFADKVLSFGPFFKKGDHKFQCDLVFYRSDNTITLCELKYYSKPVSTKIIPEVQTKCNLLPIEKGYTLEKALITQLPPDQAVIDSEFFHHVLTVEDFFS